MKLKRLWIAALVLMVFMPMRAPAADPVGGQLTSEGSLDAMTWRPVLWSFFIKTPSGGAGDENLGAIDESGRLKAGFATPKPKENIPSDVAAWDWVEPQVKIRRRAADAKAANDQRRAELTKELDAAKAKRDASQDQPELVARIRSIEAAIADIEKRNNTATMAGYAPNDFVPSGWRRTSGDAAAVPTVELWGDDGEKSLVQCVDRNKPIYLFWEPDILISADEGEKETLLKKDFHVVSLSITIHPVPKEATDADNNPATRTRARNAALETDPKDPTVVNRILVADPKPTRPWTELNFTRLTPEALTEWRPNRGGGKSEAGLWEARITAEIMGRLSEKAEYETKTLEGAIRFAVVEPGEFNLRILNADGVRKPEAGPKKP